MNVNSNQRDRQIGRPTFWRTAWAMLVVVLLSAAPTGGQPRTRLIGSAFDPAAVSVVVTPKKPRFGSSAASPLKRKLPDDVIGAARTIASLSHISAAPQLASANRPQFSLFAGGASRWLSFLKAHGPRAPPAA